MILNILKQYVPNFTTIDDTEIIFNCGNLGWHTTIRDKMGQALGSGSHKLKDVSRQIAVSETLERAVYRLLFNEQSQVVKFKLSEHPSTSGFAGGFDYKTTTFRSVCEACERFIWSKWIDDNVKINEVKINRLSDLAKYYLKDFDSVKFFQSDLICNFNNRPMPLQIGIVLGFKDKGVFPGSRLTTPEDDLWTHGCLESFRHLKIYQGAKDILIPQNIIQERVMFFAEHSEVALEQINRKKSANQFICNVNFIGEINLHNFFFLVRTLSDNYMGWHLGDKYRFVY